MIELGWRWTTTRLALDFDGDAELDVSRVLFLESVLDATICGRKDYATARGRHVELKVLTIGKRYSALAVVAMQAILGSDTRRETFNLLRALVLGDAPEFWRQDGRWNTLYSEKLGRTDMINLNDFGRDTLKVTDLDGAEAAVLTISEVETTEIGNKNKLVLHFKETEKVLFVNLTGLKVLVGKLGNEEEEWVGERVPLVKNRQPNPQMGNKLVDVLWIADGKDWDALIAQDSRESRPARKTTGKRGRAKKTTRAR